MILKVDATNRICERVALRAMFEARKRVFVDLLKWNIPVLEGSYEIDQFDDGHAIYVILCNSAYRHLASVRLLPTTRPGILSSLYMYLCDEPVPEGPKVYEITRFCLSPNMRASDRRRCRDTLVTALAHFALAEGIETYTGIAEQGWLQKILNFGWDARSLGAAQSDGRSNLGALRIEIAADTLRRLECAGIRGDELDTFCLKRAA